MHVDINLDVNIDTTRACRCKFRCEFRYQYVCKWPAQFQFPQPLIYPSPQNPTTKISYSGHWLVSLPLGLRSQSVQTGFFLDISDNCRHRFSLSHACLVIWISYSFIPVVVQMNVSSMCCAIHDCWRSSRILARLCDFIRLLGSGRKALKIFHNLTKTSNVKASSKLYSAYVLKRWLSY